MAKLVISESQFLKLKQNISETYFNQISKNIKKGDITFQLWEGGYHEMHNEPNRDEVLNVMLHWLDRYCPSQTPDPI